MHRPARSPREHLEVAREELAAGLTGHAAARALIVIADLLLAGTAVAPSGGQERGLGAAAGCGGCSGCGGTCKTRILVTSVTRIEDLEAQE